MSSIQRKNHKIHPCDSNRKHEVLIHLLNQYQDKKIVVLSSTPIKLDSQDKIVTFTDDRITSLKKNEFEILISYDLPEKAIIYMTRLALAREMAFVLLGVEDQKHLYPIETLLGRTIIQETLPGFEPSFGIAVEQKNKAEQKAQRAAREEEKRLDENKWGQRERAKPKFIGKDANGKPIFEGKTRERNHYIDGTPRTAEEKATQSKYKSKPKFFGTDTDKKNGSDKEKRNYANKTASGDKKGFSNDKKPYDKAKKPFGDKPKSKDGGKPYGEKKPFGEKKAYDGKKSFDKPAPKKTDSTPARPPRRINVKSLKPKEDKE